MADKMKPFANVDRVEGPVFDSKKMPGYKMEAQKEGNESIQDDLDRWEAIDHYQRGGPMVRDDPSVRKTLEGRIAKWYQGVEDKRSK